MKKTVIKIIIWTLVAVVAITIFWTINRKGATLNVSEAFFIQIEEKDPSPGFLARFKNYSPPVKKGSEVRYCASAEAIKGIVVNISTAYFINSELLKKTFKS